MDPYALALAASAPFSGGNYGHGLGPPLPLSAMYGSPYDLLGMGMGSGSLGMDPYSYLGMGMPPRNRLSRRDLLDMPYGYGYGRGRGSRYRDPYDLLDDMYDDDYFDDYEDIEDPLLYHLRFGGRRRPRRRFGGRGYGRWGY